MLLEGRDDHVPTGSHIAEGLFSGLDISGSGSETIIDRQHQSIPIMHGGVGFDACEERLEGIELVRPLGVQPHPVCVRTCVCVRVCVSLHLFSISVQGSRGGCSRSHLC